jgi:hypothetical protein
VKTKLNATHMAKRVSVNNVTNIICENYDERETGTDKNSWIRVVKKKLEKTKLPSIK